jgi:uncharacterized protein YbcV (DUF1398 family)
MPRRNLPQIYIDEHIKEGVVDTFTDKGFKCIFIAKTRKYAGRDEKDYIEEIYREGRLFATSDFEFADFVVVNKKKHAGIILLPSKWHDDIIELLVYEISDFIKTYIDELGKHAFRRLIVYVAEDGIHLIDEKGDDTILYSVDLLAQDYGVENY